MKRGEKGERLVRRKDKGCQKIGFRRILRKKVENLDVEGVERGTMWLACEEKHKRKEERKEKEKESKQESPPA